MRFVVFVCLISGLLRSCELLLFNKLESETLSNCYKVYNLSVLSERPIQNGIGFYPSGKSARMQTFGISG